VSFDLAVWYEPAPITTARAAAVYELLCDGHDPGLTENGGLAAFYEDLIARFPLLSGLSDDEVDHAAWSMDPTITANAVVLSLSWQTAGTAQLDVRDLADRHGLVCYDPQREWISLPTAMGAMRLHGGVCEMVLDPTPELIADAVERAAHERSHLVLERGPQLYVQVYVSSVTGSAHYGMEYRDGSPDRHMQYEAPDLDAVHDVFDGYARGDDEWRRRYDWRPWP
jgi:hypothetical protein